MVLKESFRGLLTIYEKMVKLNKKMLFHSKFKHFFISNAFLSSASVLLTFSMNSASDVA